MSEKSKKDIILDAAVEVFSEYGFHKAKMEDIAVTAGVGKGTVYEYFSSKKALFQEMIARNINNFMDMAKSEFAKHNTVTDKLYKLAEFHIEYFLANKDFTKIMITDNEMFEVDFRQWLFSIQKNRFKVIESLIINGIENGEFRQVDVNAATLVYMGSVQQALKPAILNEIIDEQELRTLVKNTVSIVLAGIKK